MRRVKQGRWHLDEVFVKFLAKRTTFGVRLITKERCWKPVSQRNTTRQQR